MNTKNVTNKIYFIISFVLFQIAEIGFALAYIFGGVGLAAKSLIYIIPILLADIGLWLRSRRIRVFESINPNKFSLLNLILFTALLYLVSIIMLFSYPTRPWAYFIIISLISGLIFAQILYKRKGWTDRLIISEVILLSLNLIWGVSLKYPLYFGYTDTLTHLSYINTIVQTSHTTAIGLDYLYYPLFHIFNAMGIEISNLSLKLGLFILGGISWQVGILFAYLIFKKLSNSRIFALIACLLFALNDQIIYYGSYSVTRSLAFVFALVFLYLIMQRVHIKFIFMSVIVMTAFIITHHITVLFFIPVLIIFYFFQNIFPRNPLQEYKIQAVGIQLLIISFFAYTFYLATAFSIPAMQNLIMALGPGETVIAIVHSPLLITTIYYSFVLLLSLIGIGMAFDTNKIPDIHKNIIGIALSSLVFLLFYVQAPIDLLPQANIALLYRLPLLVSPFIVYMIAYGINYILNNEQSLLQNISKKLLPVPFITISLLVIITFFSTICGSNATDIPYISKTTNVSSQYFTNAELKSFSFVKDNVSYSSPLYSDYETIRNELDFKDFSSKQTLTASMQGIQQITNGYIIFRIGELEKTGGLTFSEIGLRSNTDILEYLLNDTCVYSNDNVQIFEINQ